MAGSPLALIEFPADDPERARLFWSGLLDLALNSRSGGEGEGWQTRSFGPAVGVHPRAPDPGDSSPLPYFEVEDLSAPWSRYRCSEEASFTPATSGRSQGLRGKPLRPDRPRTRRLPIATIRRAAWSATGSTMARRSNTGTALKNGRSRAPGWGVMGTQRPARQPVDRAHLGLHRAGGSPPAGGLEHVLEGG